MNTIKFKSTAFLLFLFTSVNGLFMISKNDDKNGIKILLQKTFEVLMRLH